MDIIYKGFLKILKIECFYEYFIVGLITTKAENFMLNKKLLHLEFNSCPGLWILK